MSNFEKINGQDPSPEKKEQPIYVEYDIVKDCFVKNKYQNPPFKIIGDELYLAPITEGMKTNQSYDTIISRCFYLSDRSGDSYIVKRPAKVEPIGDGIWKLITKGEIVSTQEEAIPELKQDKKITIENIKIFYDDLVNDYEEYQESQGVDELKNLKEEFVNFYHSLLNEFNDGFLEKDSDDYKEVKEILDNLNVNIIPGIKNYILKLENPKVESKEEFSEYSLVGFDRSNFSDKDKEILNKIKELENKENLIVKYNTGVVIPIKFVRPIEIEKENYKGKDLYTIKVYNLNNDSTDFDQSSYGMNIDLIIESPDSDFSYEKWFEENKKVEPIGEKNKEEENIDFSKYDDKRYDEFKKRYDPIIKFIRENFGEEDKEMKYFVIVDAIKKEDGGLSGTQKVFNNYHDYLIARNGMSEEQKLMCDVGGWGKNDNYSGWKSPVLYPQIKGFQGELGNLSPEKQQEWNDLIRQASNCELQDEFIEAIKNGELKEELEQDLKPEPAVDTKNEVEKLKDKLDLLSLEQLDYIFEKIYGSKLPLNPDVTPEYTQEQCLVDNILAQVDKLKICLVDNILAQVDKLKIDFARIDEIINEAIAKKEELDFYDKINLLGENKNYLISYLLKIDYLSVKDSDISSLFEKSKTDENIVKTIDRLIEGQNITKEFKTMDDLCYKDFGGAICPIKILNVGFTEEGGLQYMIEASRVDDGEKVYLYIDGIKRKEDFEQDLKPESAVDTKSEIENLKDRLNLLILDQLIYIYQEFTPDIFLSKADSKEKEYYINNILRLINKNQMAIPTVDEEIEKVLKKDFSIQYTVSQDIIKSVEKMVVMKNLISARGGIILKIVEPIVVERKFGIDFVGVYASNETKTGFKDEIELINIKSIKVVDKDFDYDKYFEENRNKLKNTVEELKSKDLDLEQLVYIYKELTTSIVFSNIISPKVISENITSEDIINYIAEYVIALNIDFVRVEEIISKVDIKPDKSIEPTPQPEVTTPVNTSLVEINKQNYKDQFRIFQGDIKNIDNASLKELDILSKRAESFINYIENNRSKLSQKQKNSIDKDYDNLINKYLVSLKYCINNFDADQKKKFNENFSYRANLDRARAKKGNISEESLQFTSLEKLQEAVEKNPELKDQFRGLLEMILKKSKDFKENELEGIIKKLSESTGLSVEDIREIYNNQQTLIESQAKSEVLGNLKKIRIFKKDIPLPTKEILTKMGIYLGAGLGISFLYPLIPGAVALSTLSLGIAYGSIGVARILDNFFTDKDTKKKQNKKVEEIKQSHSMDDLLARNLLASMTLKKRLQVQNVDLGNANPEDIEKNIDLYIREIHPDKSEEEISDLVKSMSTLYQIDQNNKKLEDKISKKSWFQKLSENKIFQEITTIYGILKPSQNIHEKNLTTGIVCVFGIAARSIPVLREVLGAYVGYRIGGTIGDLFFIEKGVEISIKDLSKILNKKEDLSDKDKQKFTLAKVKLSEKGFKENNPGIYLQLKDLINKYEELEVLRLKDKNLDSSAKLIESLNDDFETQITKKMNASNRNKAIRIGFKVGGTAIGLLFGHFAADMQRRSDIIKHINESGKLKTEELNNIMSNPVYAKHHNVIEALIRNNELSDKAINDIMGNPDFMKDHGILSALIGNNELSDKAIHDIMGDPDFMKDHGIVASLIRSDQDLTGRVQEILKNNSEISKNQDILESLYKSTSDSGEKQHIYSALEKLQNSKSGGAKNIIETIRDNTAPKAKPDSLRSTASSDSSKVVAPSDSTGVKPVETVTVPETPTADSTDLENVQQFIKGTDLDKIKIEKLYDALKSDGDKKLIHDALENAKHIEHIDKGEYVSGVLHKGVTIDSKLIVINPDGSLMQDADINTIIHPEDTLIETKGGVMILMKTSGVTVGENDHLDLEEVIHLVDTGSSEKGLTELQKLQREIAQLNQDHDSGKMSQDIFDKQYHELQDQIKGLKSGNGTGAEVVKEVAPIPPVDNAQSSAPTSNGENLTEIQKLQKEIADLNQQKTSSQISEDDFNNQYHELQDQIEKLKNSGSGNSEAVNNLADQASQTGGSTETTVLDQVAQGTNQGSGGDTASNFIEGTTKSGQGSGSVVKTEDVHDLSSINKPEVKIEKPIDLDDGGDAGVKVIEEAPKSIPVSDDGSGSSSVILKSEVAPGKVDSDVVTELAKQEVDLGNVDKEVTLEGFKITANDEIKDGIVERILDANVKGEEINMDKAYGFEIDHENVTRLTYVGTDEWGDKVFEVQSGDKKLGEAIFDIDKPKNTITLEKINPQEVSSDIPASPQYTPESFYSQNDSIAFDNIQKISPKLDKLIPGDNLNKINIELESGNIVHDLKFLGENNGRYIFDSNSSGSKQIIFEPKYNASGDLQEVKVVNPTPEDIEVLNEANPKSTSSIGKVVFDEPGRKGDVVTEVGNNSFKQTVDMQLSGEIVKYSHDKSSDLYDLLQGHKIKSEAKFLDFMSEVKKEFSGNGTLEDVDKKNWSIIFESFKKNPNSPVLNAKIQANMSAFVAKLERK